MKAYGKVTPDDQASASMLPAILGISDYSTPNDSLQTCIRAIDGLERENITNESMEWGNDLEGRILIRAAERLGLDNLELDHEAPYHHKLLKHYRHNNLQQQQQLKCRQFLASLWSCQPSSDNS